MTGETVDQKNCSLCAEPIPVGAIKCRYCDGYQGRWFFLNLSTPVLSLLVALVSILSLTLSALITSFDRPRSDVRVVFQYFEDGTAYFVAANLGARPGSIGEVYLDAGDEAKRYALSGPPNSRFIAPGTSKQVAFRLPCSQDFGPQVQYAESGKFGSRPLAKDTRINVIVTQFDGSSQTQSTPIGKLSSLQAMNDRLHACIQDELTDAAKK